MVGHDAAAGIHDGGPFQGSRSFGALEASRQAWTARGDLQPKRCEPWLGCRGLVLVFRPDPRLESIPAARRLGVDPSSALRRLDGSVHGRDARHWLDGLRLDEGRRRLLTAAPAQQGIQDQKQRQEQQPQTPRAAPGAPVAVAQPQPGTYRRTLVLEPSSEGGLAGLQLPSGGAAAQSPTLQPKMSAPEALRHSSGRNEMGVNTDGGLTSATANGQGNGSEGATRRLPPKTSRSGERA